MTDELPGMWEEADMAGGETDDFPSWVNQPTPPPLTAVPDLPDGSTGEWLNFMERQDAFDRRPFGRRVRDWFVRRVTRG